MSAAVFRERRPSGVAVFGDIPSDWQTVALRHLLEFENGQIDPRVEPYASAILIAPNHIESGTGRLLETEFARDQGAISGKYRVRAGDIVYSKIRPALRKVTVSESDCLCSADMYALRPLGQGDSRFFFWSLLSDYFSKTVILESERVAMPKVNRESLGAVLLLRPPLSEQTQIAGFLDYETAKIDKLIDKQQQLIALLKEKRQAVISHAVTRGLNPDAPMKDYGVEWLGQVPAHWVVAPIKHAFQNLDFRRVPLSTTERGERQGEYDYYGASGVIDHIDDYLFDETTILVGEDGANLVNRSTPLAFPAFGKYWVNNHAHILRPLDSAIRFWVEAIEHIDVNPLVSGSAQPKLTAEALMNLKVAFPPTLEERRSIDTFITARDEKLAALQRHAASQVDLLQERRTALISAAVTGKIDVRGWKPPEGADATEDVA